MQKTSPLWPAALDHIRLDAEHLESMVAFYRDAMGMQPVPLADGSLLMQAPQRRIVLGIGQRGAQPYSAFRLQDLAQLEALRSHVQRRGLTPLPSPTPLFAEGAFALRDPDGRQIVFGLQARELPSPGEAGNAAMRLPGRLQHVVVASSALAPMLRFYEEDLGFVVSDYVHEGDTPTVGFFRSSPEHHSFAVFRCPQTRPDHHAYETNCWNDIRDWADHMASLRIKLWWGPGRHGPGNNLFFMVQDPQGYLVELSAELETVPDEVTKRSWRHEERTLNLWGPGFMRS
ncbi:MAG TPA: VOC family protein [Variovorax sp.]|nr:VOC family protein [Variovorax sp.]